MVSSVVLTYSTLTLEFVRDDVLPVAAVVIGSPVCASHLLRLPRVCDWLSFSLPQTSLCGALMGHSVIFSIEDMDV